MTGCSAVFVGGVVADRGQQDTLTIGKAGAMVSPVGHTARTVGCRIIGIEIGPKMTLGAIRAIFRSGMNCNR